MVSTDYRPTLTQTQLQSHFAARWDRDADTWVVDDHSANGIIGAILVARGIHCSVQQAQSTIVEHLNVEDSNINAIPSEQTPHGKSDLDHWTRKALHVLQADSIIPSFDVGEFMTFAHAYAAKRQENQGAARCTYPMLDRRDDGSKKRFSTV